MRFSLASGSLIGFLVLFTSGGVVNSRLVLVNAFARPHFELENVIHRAKRDTNKTENHVDPNTRCVIRNLKEIEQKLEKALPPEKNVSKAAALAKPHQLFSNADPSTVEKFCEIYKASRSRLAACGDSQMKSFAAKALAVVDFVCIDRYEEFVGAFPCIQKVDEQMDASCQKNCSKYESAAEKLNTAGASVVKKYNSNEIKELFAHSCLYVSCVMECQRPVLAAKCGNKILELEMNSIGVTFRNLDEMMKESSAYNVWPDECKPLSSMGAEHSGKTEPSSPITSTTTTPAIEKNATAAANGTSISQAAPTSTSQVSTTSLPRSNSTTVASVSTAPAANVTSSPASRNATVSVSAPSAKATSVSPVVNATVGAKLRSLRRN